MNPPRYVLLSTVQSTGTWWAIDALRRHPEIGGLSDVRNLMAHQNSWVLSSACGASGCEGNPHGEALAPDGQITLLYEHYQCMFPVNSQEAWPGVLPQFRRWDPQSVSESLMLVVPTLSSLRDPLACMIRAWHREPSLYPYDWLIDQWIHVAKRGDTLGVKFWRMDPFDQAGFVDAVQGVGLSTPDEWLSALTPGERINATPGENDLRKYYRGRDAGSLEKFLPKPWRRLREAELILRPFLERSGFRDLLWWS